MIGLWYKLQTCNSANGETLNGQYRAKPYGNIYKEGVETSEKGLVHLVG